MCIRDRYSPMKGEILPVDRSMDEVFASRALGDGIALNPEDVYKRQV